jgi:ParB family chromosome partitioning protein
MARRKRLTPSVLSETGEATVPAGLETKSMIRPGVAPAPMVRAPIAQVAGEAAAQSALDELADEMRDIRSSGRLVTPLALSVISEDHMVRDRMVNDPEEMASLKASLVARGQQTPIEVVETGQGRYGLISGWRRLHAIRDLHTETGEERFAQIQALIKPIDSVSEAYVSMVEENEIRANLSFYERAHLACEAVRLGVYPTTKQAVQVLFANATPAKRSKIGSFVKLHEGAGAALQFPAAIPEHLGLALVGAISGDTGFAQQLKASLRKTPPQSAEQERAVLEQALQQTLGKKATPKAAEIAPGVHLEARKGRVVLSGKGVTGALLRDLSAWLAKR